MSKIFFYFRLHLLYTKLHTKRTINLLISNPTSTLYYDKQDKRNRNDESAGVYAFCLCNKSPSHPPLGINLSISVFVYIDIFIHLSTTSFPSQIINKGNPAQVCCNYYRPIRAPNILSSTVLSSSS